MRVRAERRGSIAARSTPFARQRGDGGRPVIPVACNHSNWLRSSCDDRDAHRSQALHRSPAFSWVVRVPAGADTVYVGGQNGVGPDGTVVGAGMSEQTRQALANLRTCLQAAGAEVTDIVRWTIFYAEGADVQSGLAAFGDFWPRDAAPPAITVVKVSDVGPPGALVEIDAIAAVRS